MTSSRANKFVNNQISCYLFRTAFSRQDVGRAVDLLRTSDQLLFVSNRVQQAGCWESCRFAEIIGSTTSQLLGHRGRAWPTVLGSKTIMSGCNFCSSWWTSISRRARDAWKGSATRLSKLGSPAPGASTCESL